MFLTSHPCPFFSVRFGLSVSRNEVKRLWDTLITDQKGRLEYWQFVRTFGYSLDSAGNVVSSFNSCQILVFVLLLLW